MPLKLKGFFRLKKYGSHNLFTLYVWLLSYLVVCLVLSCCSIFLYSSLVDTTQEYVEQSRKQALSKIVVNLDHDLALSNKFYVSLSSNDNIRNLIYQENPPAVQDKLAISLSQELNKLLATTNFSNAYIYFNTQNLVVSKNYRNTPKAFFDYFYQGTDLQYETWNAQMQTPNLGNYLSVHSEEGAFVDMLYQLPSYVDNSFVHATLVLRISDNILKENTDAAEMSAPVAILDRNNRLIMSSSQNLPPLYDYEAYDNGTIIADKDWVTICQTSAYNSWKYLYIADNTEYYQKIQNTKHINIAFILLSLLLCFGLGTYFSFRNYRPLNELIKTYKKQTGLTDTRQHDYEIVNDALQDYVASKRNLNSLNRENSRLRSSFSSYLADLLKGIDRLDMPAEVHFPSNLFSVILFQPYNNENLFGSEDVLEKSEAENTTFFIIQNVMEELFNQNDICYIVQLDTYIAGIYCYQDAQNAQVYKTRIHNAITQGMSFIKTNFSFDCRIGVSSVRKNKDNISLAYNEANLALTFHLDSASSIVFYDEIYRESQNAEISFYNSFSAKSENLTSCIAKGDRETAKQMLGTIFRQCISSLSVEKAKILLFNLENSILSMIDFKDNANQTEVINDILRSMNFDNLPATFEALENLIDRVCLLQNRNTASQQDSIPSDSDHPVKAEALLPKIIDYVRANYTDDTLNVTSISDTFHLTPSYLSKIFRNSTGETLAGFLASLRVEKAKALLETTDLSISEIYTQSGFANEKTFSRTFSKYESLPPGKYRKLNKR